MRVDLLKELPDVKALFDTPELREKFTRIERDRILSKSTPSDRAAELLDSMEGKASWVFGVFVTAVRQFSLKLAQQLDEADREVGGSSMASSPSSNGTATPPCVLDALLCVCVCVCVCACVCE